MYGCLYKCKYCGSEFLYAYEAIIYDQHYFKSWFRYSNQEVETIKRINFKHLLNTHFACLKNRKLLDIGCATGFLLQEAQTLGAEIYGIDINEWAVNQAKEKLLNARLYCGKLEKALEEKFFKKDYFDIIIGTDVVEHVDDFMPFLRSILSAMKRCGKACFTTPDVASLSHRLLGPHWFHYKLEHNTFITRKALSLLSKEMGFRVEKVIQVKKRLALPYIFSVLRHHNRGFINWFGILGLILVNNLFLSKSHFPFRTGEMLILISKL